ncbi:hypothetical protein ACGFK1_27780 [Mycobacterium sp. NPDC048908]|uniref:hypothetical protein n=1 Tax=Mycobacterium sp. NPDC048908 TaxID=3364292 RepID=UPI003721E529
MRVDDGALESMLEDLFPDADPDDVESFMGTLQRFGNEVAPIASRALPGAVQGAVTGAGIGGPYGALAGAALGATGALAPRPAPAAPMPLSAQVQPPTAVQPPAPLTTAPSPPMTSQAAAAAGLLELLTNRATLDALLAILMQAAGRSTVSVGDKQVPPAAFANAIAEYAAMAAEQDTTTEASADYLYGDSGWPRGDLANPAERAAILLTDLREAVQAEEIPIGTYERVAYGWRTE